VKTLNGRFRCSLPSSKSFTCNKMEAVKNETTKDSPIYVVLFQIYYISLGFLVVLFWSSYLVLIFSFRKEAIDSTPFAKILRVFPGNIRFFSSGYDVNIILVSVGSAYIFFFGVFLNLLYFRYDKGRLWEYNAIAYNVYLPETIRNGLSAIKNANVRVNVKLTNCITLE